MSLSNVRFSRIRRRVAIALVLSAMLGWGETRVLADPPSSAGDETDRVADKEEGVSVPTPKMLREGVRVTNDLAYNGSADRAGLCDVYSPTVTPPPQGFPVIVVIHGGGWMSGDKWTMATYCQRLAAEGYVAIDVNYRLAPEHKFPAQADDVREALVWVTENRERFHLNVDNVGLFGYSAGGHLAALVGLLADATPGEQRETSSWAADDPRWGQLPKIEAICVGGPPCDFRPLPQDNTALAYFFGGSQRELPEVYRAASPTVHASPGDPPVQIIHGERDLIVPLDSSRGLHEALRQVGVDSRFEIIDGQGHMVTFMHPKTSETVMRFFRETLGRSSQADAESATEGVNEVKASKMRQTAE